MINDVEQAFHNSEPVTLADGHKLYMIVELNKINETVLLDEVYYENQKFHSKHLPKVLTGWDSLYVPGLLQIVKPSWARNDTKDFNGWWGL